MDNVLTPVRDLTDSDQNQAVLDVASVLIEGGLAAERLADGYGPAVMAEAAAVARSRRRLAELAGPIHLTVVWAMYGETGRMVPRAEHPHGEDFVRTKVRQLDWLTGGLPGVTWSIIACDDGCSDQPSSADLMTEIAAAEGYPKEGNRSVTVLRLAEVIANGPSISPAFDRLTSTDQSRKGGSILAGLAAAVGSGPAQATGAGRHVVSYTDADLSANLAQLGSLAAPIVGGDKVVAALGQRYGIDGAVLIRADGPSTEPHSTGDKPDKVIILFRHFVRALLIPSLAHVLDTQAGFKAFDGPALRPVIGEMTSFNETFDTGQKKRSIIYPGGADGQGLVSGFNAPKLALCYFEKRDGKSIDACLGLGAPDRRIFVLRFDRLGGDRVSVDGARFDFSADCRGQKEAAGNWMVAVSDFSRCNDLSCRKKVVAAPTLKLAIAKTTHGL